MTWNEQNVWVSLYDKFIIKYDTLEKHFLLYMNRNGNYILIRPFISLELAKTAAKAINGE